MFKKLELLKQFKDYDYDELLDYYYDLKDYLIGEASTFGFFDWAMFKVCLISFGILLGLSFSCVFKRIKPVLIAVFIITWLYLAFRIFSPLWVEED